MAVKIRMARAGAKKRPHYHIVVADERSPRDGRYIERLGSHNPFLEKDNPARVTLKIDRVKYWLSVGAQPSDRIHLFLAEAGILPKKPFTTLTKKNQPKRKAQERLQAEMDKKAAAEQAAREAAEAEATAAAEAVQAVETVVETQEEPATETPADEEISAAEDSAAPASEEPAAE